MWINLYHTQRDHTRTLPVMLMMRIGKVPMTVRDWNMAMNVCVPKAGGYRKILRMLMVIVVLVFVYVLQRLVDVRVIVGFGEVQPHTCAHQRTGDEQFSC